MRTNQTPLYTRQTPSHTLCVCHFLGDPEKNWRVALFLPLTPQKREPAKKPPPPSIHFFGRGGEPEHSFSTGTRPARPPPERLARWRGPASGPRPGARWPAAPCRTPPTSPDRVRERSPSPDMADGRRGRYFVGMGRYLVGWADLRILWASETGKPEKTFENPAKTPCQFAQQMEGGRMGAQISDRG